MVLLKGAGAVMTVLFFALAVTGTTAAQELVKHSGVIIAADATGGTLVLAEVGPWKVRGGATVITRRTIVLTPETAFAMVFGPDDPASGFPNAFVEVPVGPWAVYVGDHVTIECRHEGARFVALKVTVTDLPGADY